MSDEPKKSTGPDEDLSVLIEMKRTKPKDPEEDSGRIDTTQLKLARKEARQAIRHERQASGSPRARKWVWLLLACVMAAAAWFYLGQKT